MSEAVITTPVTQKSQLEINFSQLTSLLTPDMQQFLILANNFEKPKVFRDGNQIVIENWPYDHNDQLNNEALEYILHSLKHLYAHGDRSGHRGIEAKRSNNEELQNNNFRMCISYTYSSIEESAEGPRRLIIKFAITHHSSRIAIGRIQPISLTKEEIAIFDANDVIKLDHDIRYGDTVAITRQMSEQEETEYFDRFVQQCIREIRQHINRNHKRAVQSGKRGAKRCPAYNAL